MNTKELPVSFFSTVPSVVDLLRMLGRVVRDWWTARFFSIELRELDNSEITEDMRREADAALAIPREDLMNV